MCNVKFSDYHIKKSEETGEINVSIIFFLTPNIQNIIMSASS